MSSAFGGAGAGGVLGSKTGDFLTWVTIGLVTVFLGLAVLMAKFYRPSDIQGEQATGMAQTDSTPLDVPEANYTSGETDASEADPAVGMSEVDEPNTSQ